MGQQNSLENGGNLVSVSVFEVPEYLRAGSFYHGLDLTCDDEIQIPANACKPDCSIIDDKDLTHLLSSLRFWGVENVPYEAMMYVASFNTDAASYRDFQDEFPILIILHNIKGKTGSEKMHIAVRFGCLSAVKFVLSSDNSLEQDLAPYYQTACEVNNLPVLRYLRDLSASPGRKDLGINDVLVAFACGSMDCLNYIHAEGLMPDLSMYKAFVGNMEDLNRLLWCQRNNKTGFGNVCFLVVPNLDTLLFAVFTGCETDTSLVSSAAASGELDVLKYAIEKGLELTSIALNSAVLQNYLECAKLLHQSGCEWSLAITQEALEGGSLDCLKYAIENGCPCAETATSLACIYGQYDCLVYLHQQGYALYDSSLEEYADDRRFRMSSGYVYRNGRAYRRGSEEGRAAEKSGDAACAAYLAQHSNQPAECVVS